LKHYEQYTRLFKNGEKNVSRSRKKTPIISHTKADSDKPFKVQEHKRERRTVKHHLTKTGDYDSMVLSDKERFGNEWNAPKDGKHYWKDDEGKWKRK